MILCISFEVYFPFLEIWLLFPNLRGSSLHADLVKAVPDEHKKFLADLVWVHEEVWLAFFASLCL